MFLTGFGIGVGTTDLEVFTPLFHARFFPDLTQVYFLPCEVLVWPVVVHLAPALTAADAGLEIEVLRRAIATNNTILFLMLFRVLSPVGFVCHTL